MRFFQTVTDTSDLDACVRVLEPDDVRTAFDLAISRSLQPVDGHRCCRDPRALSRIDERLSAGWARFGDSPAATTMRDDRSRPLRLPASKVRKLIADSPSSRPASRFWSRTVQLFSPEFEEKVAALATDDAKASEMEHAIRHEINVRVEENPVFYQSLRS